VVKKKMKASTPPHRYNQINIRDSLPLQRLRYISGSESKDDDPEDMEMLSSRVAHRGATAPFL
jgi:hypothetical protein